MALLGRQYAHHGEVLEATDTEKSLIKQGQRARKWAGDLLPYKRISRRASTTVAAVDKVTYGHWNRIWLERGNHSHDEAIRIYMDMVDEETTLSFNGARGMGRYRRRELGAIDSEGKVSIAGEPNPSLERQKVFAEDLLETLGAIHEQQQIERIRHFTGRIALNG
ncbi:MAG TPA: hypothetical protein VLG13_01205 [Patescibacteria group bacterium]|nr:hypothetical protein [Patescibacteria group bacterium]